MCTFRTLFSRFSTAKILRIKKGPEVIKGLMTSWIALFGPPKTILSDNGVQFCNKEMNDLCELIGTKHKTTAGYAPFSNGLVEKHNHIIDQMMKRIKEDLNVDAELALCWALNAKNSLENYGGYSPSQLAMGSKNPSIPYLSNSTLLDRTSSQIDGDIVNSMQKARTAFTEANHSSKLKRALKSKVENSSCSHVKTGDKVYYKRSVDDWYAKGIVVGQIGTIMWIERGGQTYKAHHTKVKKREDGTSQEMIQNSQQNERRKRNKIMINSNHEEKHERKNTGNQQRTRLRSSEERKHVDLDSSESEWSSDQEDQRTLVTELESQRASVSEPRNERASVSEPEIEEILAVESIGECTDLRAKHELIARHSVEIAEIEPNSNNQHGRRRKFCPGTRAREI